MAVTTSDELAALRDAVRELQDEMNDLRSRDAIRECLQRYARGLDRHDVELESSAFWPDAQVNYGNFFTGERDEFVAWGNDVHSERFELHQHHLTSFSIEIDGDEAHAESYVIYFLRRKDGMLDVGGARYLDRFERRDGEWRIAVREFMPDIRFEARSTFDPSHAPPTGAARWDRGDLSYVRPLPRRD